MKVDYIEAMKLALEALERCDFALAEELAAWDIDPPLHHVLEASNACGPAITALREALAEQQEPVFAIRLLTNQCFALIQERDELQEQVWRYEKNGVTCQTYRHKVDASCSECNVHEVYASPPAQQQEPVAWLHTKIEGVAVPYRPADLDRHPDRWTPLYKDPAPCPTCEALARTVMLDQTSHDAQRTWVGLTDEEVDEWTPEIHSVIRAIEAKLREKNT